MKHIFPLFFVLWMGFAQSQEERYVTVKKSVTLMGSPFEITVISLDEDLGYVYIQEAIAEIRRIEKLISSWDEESETSLINKNAGIRPVKVSPELYGLIERAVQISRISNGAFDITFSPLRDIWKFDGSMNLMPSKGKIDEVLRRVGYQNIILNRAEQTVYLSKKGMKISFGAIGKGYAADKTKALMVSKQVKAGIINADGDITTWGKKATGEKWLIGVVNPDKKGQLFSWIPILESSVATSGADTEFLTVNDKKYSHVLDPRTGYPTTGIHSVSVFAQSAELSDALATAIFVLGTNAGLDLVNQLGDTEVIIVDDRNQMFKSTGINLNQNP